MANSVLLRLGGEHSEHLIRNAGIWVRTGPPLDFLTGFVADHAAREVYGRPVGLAQLPSGDLLVADDAGDCIWAITFQRPGGDNAQPGSTSDTKTAFPPMILPGGLD